MKCSQSRGTTLLFEQQTMEAVLCFLAVILDMLFEEIRLHLNTLVQLSKATNRSEESAGRNEWDKWQEATLEVAELKLLRSSLGEWTRLEMCISEGRLSGLVGDKVREARLIWFGHVQRRDSVYTGQRMLN